jgi:hypothetical protein
MKSFAQFCADNKVTRQEKEALAWQLAMMRARRLYALLCGGWNGPRL